MLPLRPSSDWPETGFRLPAFTTADDTAEVTGYEGGKEAVATLSLDL
jgi:hypothetical protein